jgi:Double-GTPase 1
VATATYSGKATMPCLICEAKNPADGILCEECGAPMALIQEAVSQDRDPCIVTVLGESNVGKTVYLGMLLDMLSKRAEDYEAIPKGAYSVNVQHNAITYLSGRQFPAKTAVEVDDWHWAYYQVSHKQHGSAIFDLVMPDMAGEAIAAEVANPQTFRVIRSLLEKSAGAVLLVDGALAASGSPQPDLFALKLMSYLDGVVSRKRGEKIKTPVAVVLSKGDHCPECFDDPRGFARTNLNRLWNICNTRFENFDFFATSVVGSLGYGTDESGNVVQYPLHVAPRGIVEPFEWVLTTL